LPLALFGTGVLLDTFMHASRVVGTTMSLGLLSPAALGSQHPILAGLAAAVSLYYFLGALGMVYRFKTGFSEEDPRFDRLFVKDRRDAIFKILEAARKPMSRLQLLDKLKR